MSSNPAEFMAHGEIIAENALTIIKQELRVWKGPGTHAQVGLEVASPS